jgi:Peptide-N-glycosidase F, C terminal
MVLSCRFPLQGAKAADRRYDAGMMMFHALFMLMLSGVATEDPPPLPTPEMAEPTPSVQISRFDSPAEIASWAWDVTGDAKRRMPRPKVENGKLTLLESWSRSSAAIAVPFETEELAARVDISWTFVLNTGTEGLGLAWIDVSATGVGGGVPPAMTPEESRDPGGNSMLDKIEWGWEAPNLRRAFGVGIDASNPVNRDPFRGSGNIMDRPQREVSLHWDGMELIKRTTPKDFRDEQPHRMTLRIEFVTGGSDVWLTLDDELLFERYFVPGMTAFAGRAVFGARNGETAGDVFLDDVQVHTSGEIAAPAAPTGVVVFDRVLNDAGHGTNTADIELPETLEGIGRIVATLRLDKPELRFDPWDRTAHVFIENLDGSERVELIRYITPYHRGFEWNVDVSDFRPLLTGKKRLIQTCGTYGEGWLVSLRLDYYKGPAADGLIAEKVINLWCGSPEIGNPEHPPSGFYTAKEFVCEPWVRGAKVRTVVSGHGMSPNTGNAAEFMPIERTLTINDQAFKNNLWKTDNYLNPCRPQGGTWKYDRAGWAPGDIVRPWIVDAQDWIGADRTLRLSYELAPYVNEARGQTGAPVHITQSQLVLYRKE